MVEPGVRYSLRYLEKQYDEGNREPLEDLWKAFIGIKKLDPEDDNSFFRIAGLHGSPLIYRTEVDNLSNKQNKYLYWGGYCQHGNILFPTWHRAYLLYLEKALQSIEGCKDVMLPFWDETSEESLKYGIPKSLTREFITQGDKDDIPNPLLSYKFQKAVTDDLKEEHSYAKHEGYETVRYPLTGLVGTSKSREDTKVHNEQERFQNFDDRTNLLNENITRWLKGPVPEQKDGKYTDRLRIKTQFEECLKAPNYTVFSNTTSAGFYNDQKGKEPARSLEAPHNCVHLAVGGFDSADIPQDKSETQDGIIAHVNADMGENNTAAFDPIFFFHHCNIDRMFWLWQKRSQQRYHNEENEQKEDDTEILTIEKQDEQKKDDTKILTIEKGYPGVNAMDDQGPTPGFAPDTIYNMQTPLYPFLRDGTLASQQAIEEINNSSELQDKLQDKDFFISSRDESPKYAGYMDVVDIQALGYTYASGSFDDDDEEDEEGEQANSPAGPIRKLQVSSNKLEHNSSYVIIVYVKAHDKLHFLGYEAVFSRRNISKCMNCLRHLESVGHFLLPDDIHEGDVTEVVVQFISRGFVDEEISYQMPILNAGSQYERVSNGVGIVQQAPVGIVQQAPVPRQKKFLYNYKFI